MHCREPPYLHMQHTTERLMDIFSGFLHMNFNVNVNINADFWVFFPHAAATIKSHIQSYSACVKEDTKSEHSSDQYLKLCRNIQSVLR